MHRLTSYFVAACITSISTMAGGNPLTLDPGNAYFSDDAETGVFTDRWDIQGTARMEYTTEQAFGGDRSIVFERTPELGAGMKGIAGTRATGAGVFVPPAGDVDYGFKTMVFVPSGVTLDDNIFASRFMFGTAPFRTMTARQTTDPTKAILRIFVDGPLGIQTREIDRDTWVEIQVDHFVESGNNQVLIHVDGDHWLDFGTFADVITNIEIGNENFNSGKIFYDDLLLAPFPQLGGDANLDGKVTIADLGILAANWQSTDALWEHGDFSRDSAVTIADLGILAANWQAGVEMAGMHLDEALAMFDAFDGVVIPEPSAVAMFAVFGLLGLRRR